MCMSSAPVILEPGHHDTLQLCSDPGGDSIVLNLGHTNPVRIVTFPAADIQRGRDSTDYGRARRAPSHLAFHTRRIASKAVFGDAKHIYANITRIKALAFACASTAARATAGLPSHAHA